MTTKVKIPSSLDDAVQQLGALGVLIKAREWERAAIVATFVVPLENGGDRKSISATSSTDLSPTAFAALGITGLRSKDTVRRYAENWLAERPRPRPGVTVNLDGLPDWPPAPTGLATSGEGTTSRDRSDRIREQALANGSSASKAIDIASNPTAMKVAIQADPATAVAAYDAIAAASREVHDAIKFSRKSPESADSKALMARLGEMADGDDRIVKPVVAACQALEQVQRDWDSYWQGISRTGKDAVLSNLEEINILALTLRGLIEMEGELK